MKYKVSTLAAAIKRDSGGDMRTNGPLVGLKKIIVLLAVLPLLACAKASDIYRDQNMDFGAVQVVAVMPLANLTRDQVAAERVRDVLMSMLLATGGLYVVPPGEVARGAAAAGITSPTTLSKDEVLKLATIVKANAVITGVLREYGEVRSGNSTSNVISLSLQLTEAQTGRVVWSASSTKGGVTFKDRLLGGGGEPLNVITERAVDDLINKLFK